MKSFVALIVALLFSPVLWAQTSTSSYVQTERVRATLMSSHKSIRAGESFYVGLEFQIIPQWHIYWKNPGDSGEPPTYKWVLPNGIQHEDIQWPSPKRIPLSILANYGYESKVLLPVKILIPKNYASSTLVLKLDSEWLVCKEECIPESGQFEIRVAITSEASIVSAAHRQFQETLSKVPQQLDSLESHFESSSDARLRLVIPMSQLSLNPEEFEFEIFPVDSGVFEAGTAPLASFDDKTLRFELTPTAQVLELPSHLDFVLKALSKSSQQEDVSLEFSSRLRTPSNSKSQKEISLLWAILGAFLGGVLLNLMPCVLPVLSLKAFSLIKKGSSPSIRSEGVAYTLGVLLSFLCLAILLLVLRSGGEALGWGFQLQNPIFVILMSWLFVVLALNFFGLFEMGQSLQSWVGRKGQIHEEGLWGSFLSGILATLIATPCTAPFMGSAIGFALTLPPFQSLLVFTTLGFGMALPILLLSWFPKALRFLPSPGPWMESFKQFMGFPMLATSCWLLWVYGTQTNGDAVIRFLFASLGLAMSLWILGKFHSSWKRNIAVLVSVSLTLIIALPLVKESKSSSSGSTQSKTEYSGLDYESYSRARLEELIEAGRPVYVDFTATWCLMCQVNKRVVFPDSDVQSLFREKNIMILKADWTDKNPDLLKELEAFGRSGVPLNVYYEGRGTQPTLLPSVLRPQIVIDAISHRAP